MAMGVFKRSTAWVFNVWKVLSASEINRELDFDWVTRFPSEIEIKFNGNLGTLMRARRV